MLIIEVTEFIDAVGMVYVWKHDIQPHDKHKNFIDFVEEQLITTQDSYKNPLRLKLAIDRFKTSPNFLWKERSVGYFIDLIAI